MEGVIAACVLVRLAETGWIVQLVAGPGGPCQHWIPLGLGTEASACEALERARALFPGRLVAVYHP
ncbi:MAG: hypothetical protein K6U88_04330 [Dehalococcoidia bacterium]|nr:hypothetical protein [Dehalococcoidia bacterium]